MVKIFANRASLEPALAVSSELPADPVVKNQRGHVAELDGIRALAILAVLVEHLIFLSPATAAGRAWIPRPIAAILGHSWLGVDLFFVLSGFLITGILLKSKKLSRGEYFRRFYLRRALRIWPLYFFILAVLWIAYGSYFATYFTMCVLFVANLASGTIPAPDGAGPFWSLSVEEQFYLVWPWCVLWLNRRRLMTAAIAIVAIELVARFFVVPSETYLTWFRADGLAMGAFIAAWFADGHRTQRDARKLALLLLAGAPVTAVIAFVFSRLHLGVTHSPTISAAVCVFGALVVVAVTFSGHRLLAVLRTRFLAVTALLSYSIYLLHRPIVDAFTLVYGNATWFAHFTPAQQTIVRTLIVVAICYALATATRYAIELPFLRLGRESKVRVTG